MRKIEVLDQHTIDKIAAGEVVERPASVVKELVENAIDAGATAVTVEISDGGKKLIRITDNGSGIEAEQVPQAFLSHATSKIRQVEDLENIGSLGFRGEALSSIAAVAQVELITKTPTAISGVRYVIEGGQEQSLEEMGAPEGTTFLVRNLFYNTPARSKFLKSDASEAGYISALLEQLALSHPEISFKYIQNKQVKLHTSGSGQVKDVIYSIYGREITRALLELSYKNDFMEITGFAGKPEISRGNRTFENYYINGRYVKNNIVTKAIEDAYKGFLMQHKFPFVSLHIQMTGNDLDVNVHPRKLEVRFARGPEVYQAVFDAVKGALCRREMIQNVPVGAEETAREKTAPVSRREIPEPFESRRREQLQYRSPAVNISPVSDRPAAYEKPQEPAFTASEEALFAGQLAQKEKTFSAKENEPQRELFQTTEEESGSESDAAARMPQTDTKADFFAEMSGAEIQKEQKNPAITGENQEIKGTPEREAVPEKEEKPQQLELFEERLLAPESRVRHRLIGQLFETYWLLEFDDKLFIMDQHAAHEKVNYEHFVRYFKEKKIEPQLLSPPILVTLSLEEEMRLKANLPYFERAGFEIEYFGGREYCISAVPADLFGFTGEGLFLEMLDHLSGEADADAQEVFTARLATMACKAAVKGNNQLSFEEANRLIDELLTLENPYQCPHGRPTIISMSKTEIEKKFNRIK